MHTHINELHDDSLSPTNRWMSFGDCKQPAKTRFQQQQQKNWFDTSFQLSISLLVNRIKMRIAIGFELHFYLPLKRKNIVQYVQCSCRHWVAATISIDRSISIHLFRLRGTTAMEMKRVYKRDDWWSTSRNQLLTIVVSVNREVNSSPAQSSPTFHHALSLRFNWYCADCIHSFNARSQSRSLG